MHSSDERFRCRFPRSRKSVMKLLQRMETTREFEDVKDMPPLDIIHYRDLMETAWSWDRLLPWDSGYVLLQDYLDYLNEFFQRNAPAILSLHASATRCLEIEEKLNSCAEGFTADHYRLSDEIKEYARFMIESDLESPAASAGLMCIAEEAEFMCELWACRTKNDVEEDGFFMEVLEDDNLNVSNYIRHVVFHILTTYKGPSSDCLAASMLGMQKEANILRELLDGNRIDCFARLHVCDDIRPRLWKRISLIAARIYPIDHPYTPITKMVPKLMPYEQIKESGNADKMGFHITNDGSAVLNTPTITTAAAPAAPVSWVVNIDEHDQENTDNSNTKSMGDTQGSEVPISQTSGPSIVSGNAANKLVGQVNRIVQSSDERFWCGFAMNNREQMIFRLEQMETKWEFEDVKYVPPLDIIHYRDLMETAWSWDRLLAWDSGYVLFEDYLDYLNEFFERNAPAILSLHASATRCLEMEEKLSSCVQGFTADHYRLSDGIKEYARFMIESDLESPTAAAGLMCIAEEAEFMCELWACKIKNDVEDDDFVTEVLEDDNLNFSNYIRHVVFHVLGTYKGPSSDCLAAFMLGMQKEANILRELLTRNRMDCFARLHICDYIRPRLCNRLRLIAAKIYPIDNPYTPITKMLPKLMPIYKQCKESGNADEMGFHIADCGVSILNTPTITTTVAPAAPVSWVVNVDEHDQENKDNNNNTKSMGDTKGSEVPISRTSDPNVVIGTAANKRDGYRVWKPDDGYVEYELLRGVSPPYEQAEATDGPNAGGEEKHMLEKTSAIEEGSMKALVELGKEIVALLKALLVVLLAVLCALCVVVYLLNLSRREIDV